MVPSVYFARPPVDLVDMMALLSSPTAGIVLASLFIVVIRLYNAIKPKPIPGIPYRKASAKRLLGDVPDGLKHIAETSELSSFLTDVCTELQSPIVQVFMRPFAKPWVVLSDTRESHDIMARRTREFDRSKFLGDLFIAVIPDSHISMRTNERWRANRRLLADTMATTFLHNAASPHIYAAFTDLLALWHEKERLASGRPFSAAEDIDETMFDAISGTAFGLTPGTVRKQIDLLSNLSRVELPIDSHDLVNLPHAQPSEELEMLVSLCHSSEIPIKSPLGQLHHQFAIKIYPKYRKAMGVKDRILKERLEAAWEKFKDSDTSEDDVKCATDLVVEREVSQAKKDGRAPSYDSPTTRDELFIFLVGGHETTSTTIQWALKYLSRSTDVQRNLRNSLRTAFPQEASACQIPEAAEIIQAHLPYLDAVIEEVIRCGGTTPVGIRVATQDTQIFGYHIPKGTDIFTPNQGPSYKSPPLDIDESRRSKTSQQMGPGSFWSDQWDPADLGAFKPGRWLIQNENGDIQFESRAGPQHGFGAGTRSCFGKKLARLTLRLAFAIIIWNYHLEELPRQLSDMKATDVLTRKPQNCYVRLKSVV